MYKQLEEQALANLERAKSDFAEAVLRSNRAKINLELALKQAECKHKNVKHQNESWALFKEECEDCGLTVYW